MQESQLAITRLAPRTVVLLQIHGGDVGAMAPLTAKVIGAPDGGESATVGPRAYSIGPTEWLLIDYALDEMRRRLSGVQGRVLMRLTDLSGAFTCLRLEGKAARTVLASDIGAPWAAATARPGQYVRTRLAQVEVMMHCIGPDSFELHVQRNVVEHLEGWLTAQHEAAQHASVLQ